MPSVWQQVLKMQSHFVTVALMWEGGWRLISKENWQPVSRFCSIHLMDGRVYTFFDTWLHWGGLDRCQSISNACRWHWLRNSDPAVSWEFSPESAAVPRDTIPAGTQGSQTKAASPDFINTSTQASQLKTDLKMLLFHYFLTKMAAHISAVW